MVAAAVVLMPIAFLFTFHASPDIEISRLFHDPQGGWIGETDPVHRTLRRIFQLSGLLPAACLAISLIRRLYLGRWWLGLDLRAIIFAILVVAIGNGLVVNVLLKDQWGRARPRQVEAFGGTADYTHPWVVTDQCRRNCSFVSGEAGYGFSYAAIAFVPAFARRRHVLLTAGVGAGVVFGYVRIAAGGHFISDVFWAGIVTIAMIGLLHRLVYGVRLPTVPGRPIVARGNGSGETP